MGTAPVGSPLFMAPEQTDAFGNICPATDVWALGLLAFYLLTGRSYWLGAERASVPALLREVCLDPLVSASFRADQLAVSELIPEGFDDWFAHCVERDTDGRYVEAGEAVRAFLEAVPEGLPIEPTSLGHVFAGPADDSQDTPFSARGSDALPLALHPTSLPPPPDSHAPDLEALPEYASIEDPYESFPSSDSDFQAAWGAPSFDVDAPSSEDSNGDFTKEGPSGPTPDSVAGLAMDFGFGSESASDLGPSATDLGAPSEGIEAAADLHAAEPGRKSPTSPSEKRPKLKRSMQVVAAGVALGTLLGGVAGWRTRSASSVAARQSAQAPKEAPSSVPPRKPCPAGMILEPGRSSPTELLPFCIDRTEVTVLAFARCVEAGSCDHVTSGTDYPPARDRLKDAYASLCNSRGHAPGKTSPLDLVQVRGGEVTASDLSAGVSNSDPINCIDWWSATTYCQWMKGRLPSEEEWRFAANAIPPKPVGRRTDPSEPEEPTANLCGGECFDWGLGHGQLLRAQSEQWDGFAGTSPVGAFARFDVPGVPADLDGNVAEWTSTQSSSGAEAPLPAGKSYRAVLGKAFMPRPQQGSEADRSLVDPAAKSYLIGFRCVSSTAIELPQSPAEPAESGTPIEYGPPLPPAIAAGGDPVALVVASALPAETAAQPVQVPSAPAESAAPSDDAPLRELVREEMPVPPRE